MRQTLEQLRAYQELMQQIAQREHDAEMLNADVRNAERTVRERAQRRDESHQQRLETVKQGDALQLRIEEAEEQIKRLDIQLNSIKNTDRYKAVQESIASHQADIDKWEDEALASMQRAEELATNEENLAEGLGQAEQDLRATQAEVDAEREKLADKVAALRHEADTLRRQVDPNVMAAYDRLAASRKGTALAEVRNRVCQGCRTQITKQSENMLMKNHEIVYCHSCGRMLILGD
jgi:predicted  nucleic acid-binding Zn-ribbon protein